ncbi:uncharacterized protein LOC130645991 [Hydractinia symbiolongicarpus]|uniref:uncharacterized protein LOC130645991 n=1 Tax=Hydractinia symbiolongicarpus TaxID=13093 RepID=UPI00254AAE5A|nr:uncharacterized protein LOC130645991 [Hydractinia symbiolongicarpus]
MSLSNPKRYVKKRKSFIGLALQFKLSNKDLRSSDAYRQCQNRLLNEEIYIKKSTIRTLENQFNVHRNSLRASLSYLDFTHITCLFLARNDRILAANDETQKKKLFNLGLQSVPTKHDPDRVIHNFSSHILSEADKSLLARGLNYAIPSSKVEYADYMVSFEKLYRNVKSMEMSSETRDLLKSRMKDCAISSFESYNSSKKPKNLSDEELEALFSLANNLDLVIQKSDKGNSVVLVDKDIYVNKISDILNDTAKFAKVKCDKEKELNFIINQEKKVTAVLKTLLDNGSLERRLHEKLKPTGSKLGILYGLCKIHKSIVNGSPPFRPILSAIDTPTCNLAKFLVPLLAPLTVNEYTVFSSFSFAEEISKQDSSLFMASLDVDSLFTNIPLQETIDICTDSLFSETDPVSNFCKSDFRKLLSLATENSYFTFDGQLFKQVDGVAMGSPLGPSLANAFLSHHEKTWLDNCPSSFKPVYYRRYVDDVFVLFSSPSHLPLFKDYLNRQHINISFTSECEADKTLPFLDVSVSGMNRSLLHLSIGSLHLVVFTRITTAFFRKNIKRV